MKIFKPRTPRTPDAFSIAVAPSPEALRRQEEYSSLPIDVAIGRVKAELDKLRGKLGLIAEIDRDGPEKYLRMVGEEMAANWGAWQIARLGTAQRKQVAVDTQAEIDRILQAVQ